MVALDARKPTLDVYSYLKEKYLILLPPNLRTLILKSFNYKLVKQATV